MAGAPPLVSIVTPAFNQGQFLEETICSVLEQDYVPIEYIVIDGGSTDGTRQILERYSTRLAFWESTPDRGQAHAINKGLRRATGSLLGWLNADDVLLPGAVRRSVRAFQDHPEVDVVYSRLERINADGLLIPTPILPKDREVFSLKAVVGECIVNQPGSFWRREAMERSGMLAENLIFALDYEHWIRFVLDGSLFYRLEEPLARFRVHTDSKTTSRTAAMAEEQEAVLQQLLERDDLPRCLGMSEGEICRLARHAKARIRLHAAYGYLKSAQWLDALNAIAVALSYDPAVLFDRRWFDLLLARIKRPPTLT